MSDETATLADATPSPAALAATPATTPAVDASPETLSLDEAKKLRSESASLRKRLRELEAAEEQRTQATLTEQEKLAKQAQALQAERDQLASALREERGRAAVTQAAAKLGAAPDLVARLVTVEFDEAGQPTGVEQAVAALLKQHPQLVVAQSAALGNGARQSGQGQAETAEQRRARVYGAGADIFNPQSARNRGGGVVFRDPQE